MHSIKAYGSPYPDMTERRDGGYLRRDDAESLAGALLALVKSGDQAASDYFNALEQTKSDAFILFAALQKIAAGDLIKDEWTLGDVIQEHYKIAREAIAKVGPR